MLYSCRTSCLFRLLVMIQRYIIFLLLPCVCLAGSPTVLTNSGEIVGSEVTFNGTVVDQYLSIPYAQPPVGPLRFRITKPVEPWTEPLVADSWPPSCWQYSPYDYPWTDNLPNHSEDCLYLNIWAPQGDDGIPRAVMFWIHGGDFATGSSRLPPYRGQVLAAEGDVVVVTINYRLNIFGFLSTDTVQAPGNMGLYDVLEALKWVNENIQAFGGDKNRITLFGQSAGSYTCAYCTVSPLTKGLFYQVIMESGAQDDVVSQGGNPLKNNLNIGQDVAEALNCSPGNTTLENSPLEVVRCLREIPAEDLTNTVYKVYPSAENFIPIYGDEIMPTTLFQGVKLGLVHEGVKVLVGNVQDEGSITLGEAYSEEFGPYGEKDPPVNATYAKYLITSYLNILNTSWEIADWFLEGVPEDAYETAVRQAFFAIGDFVWFCPPLYYAEMVSDQGHDVYYYYYDHQSANTVFAPWMGVTHASEIPFVFGRPLDSANYTQAEEVFSEKIMRYWTNFAKFGNPSKTWEKFSTENPYAKILRIDENYPVYLPAQLNNCVYLRDYYPF